MKIFISWSGVRSYAVAEALHDWLPQVMQAVNLWISSEDIRKGKQWGLALAEELESTHVGVMCLTPENLTAPWVLFEAGALSKLRREQDARVCTYLIGLSHATVTGPLAEFQHTLATKDDTYRLVQTINAAMADGQGRLTDTHLKRAFARCWPELEQCLETLPEPQEPIPPPRKAEDMVQELLELVRSLVNPQPLSYRPVLGQFSRILARLRSITDLGWSVPNEDVDDFIDEMRQFQGQFTQFHDATAHIREQFTKEARELQQLTEQFGQELNRVKALPPAREAEVPLSSGSPAAQRKNRPAAKVRQTHQRRRPS